MARLVCFHGKTKCAYCGPAQAAAWRIVALVHRCAACSRKVKRPGTCDRCTAAGHEPLELPDPIPA